MTSKEQATYEMALDHVAAVERRGHPFMDLRTFDLTEANLPLIIGRLSASSHIEHLWLSYCGQLPDLAPIAALNSLKTLSLSGCDRLTDLTPLSAFTSLKELNLYICKYVTDLTPLAALTSLQVLNFHNCHYISELAPLAGLTSLRTLELWACLDLTDLTPLAALRSLRSLNLRLCAALTDLSPLGSLTSLEELDLAICTKITEIGPLATLASLRRLNLNQCFGITRISPIRPLFLASLEELDVGAAPITDLPQGIVWEYPADLATKLRAHYADLAAGEVEDAEIKVFLLGNGGAGKTQLSRALRDLPYDENIPTTHGIQLESTAISLERHSQSIRLNFWDFGGQDFYLGTHSLFVQGRSVHLLLWTPQLELDNDYIEGDLSMRHHPLVYWLDYLRAFANVGTSARVASPVIVIQSKCDHEEDRVDKPPVGDILDFEFVQFEQVSSKEGLYFDELKAALKKAVRRSLRLHKPDQIGIGRVRVRDRLRLMLSEGPNSVRTLTRDTFDRMCAEDGCVSNSCALLEYLHHSGVLFYRRGLFSNQIILDQSWALQAIYTLFEREAVQPLLKAQGGRFTRKHLERLAWSNFTHKEQKLFLDMMQSCGICFRIRKLREGESEYLAPELLPDWHEARERMLIAPLEDLPPKEEVEVLFPYLHEGVLRNYLCRIGEHVSGAANYWRYGFAFHEESTKSTVLMRSTWDVRAGRIGPGSVTLKAWGGDAKKLLQPLLAELEGLPIGQTPTIRWKPMSESRTMAQQDTDDKSRTQVLANFSFSPVGSESSSPREIYMSYAWGDDSTDAGKKRSEIADGVEKCAREEGWIVCRDKEDIAPGNSISEFMERIMHGGRVLLIVSERYLQSSRCMAELNGIFEDARSNEVEFRRRIVPVVLSDANIGTINGRSRAAEYWQSEVNKITRLKHLGKQDYAEYHSMKEWVLKIGDILRYISNTLVPWGYDDIVRDNYASLRKLLANR